MLRNKVEAFLHELSCLNVPFQMDDTKQRAIMVVGYFSSKSFQFG